MYAVVETGGKQYKVTPETTMLVEKLEGKSGDKIELANVIAYYDGKALKVGTPSVDGIAVQAEIVEQAKGDKVIIFKKKRRHNYRRTKGHRQDLTMLKVTGIGKAGASGKAATAKAETTKDAAAKPAAKKTAAKSTAKKASSTPAAKETKSAAKKSAPKKASTSAKATKSTAKKKEEK